MPYIDKNQSWVYMCSPSWLPHHHPPHSIPQGHPSTPALSALSHASNLDWRSVSHMIIYMFHCFSLKLSHPRLLPPYSFWILCLFSISKQGKRWDFPRTQITIYFENMTFVTYSFLMRKLSSGKTSRLASSIPLMKNSKAIDVSEHFLIFLSLQVEALRNDTVPN